MDSQNNRHKLHLLSEALANRFTLSCIPPVSFRTRPASLRVPLSISTEVILVNSCSACPKARCCVAAFSIPPHCQRKEFTKFCDHLEPRFPGSWYILPLESFSWVKLLVFMLAFKALNDQDPAKKMIHMLQSLDIEPFVPVPVMPEHYIPSLDNQLS